MVFIKSRDFWFSFQLQIVQYLSCFYVNKSAFDDIPEQLEPSSVESIPSNMACLTPITTKLSWTLLRYPGPSVFLRNFLIRFHKIELIFPIPLSHIENFKSSVLLVDTISSFTFLQSNGILNITIYLFAIVQYCSVCGLCLPIDRDVDWWTDLTAWYCSDVNICSCVPFNVLVRYQNTL